MAKASRYRYSKRPRGSQRFIKKAAYAAAFGLAGQYLRKRQPTKGSVPLRKGRRVGNLRGRLQSVGRVRRHGENATLSSSWIGRKKRQRFSGLMYAKMAAPQTYQITQVGNLSSTQGRQRVYSFGYLTRLDLRTTKEALLAGSTTTKNIRYVVKSGRMKIMLRNQSNSNARMTIYDISCKRHAVAQGIDTPDEAFSVGLNDLSTGTSTYDLVGATPYKSPEFRRNYYVNRVTYVNMEPGESHEHIMHFNYNKVLDTVQIEHIVDAQGIPGFTRFCMIVFHGMLGHESATPDKVTYMPVTIDYDMMREWSVAYLDTPLPTITRTELRATNVTNFDFMGETGDADVDNITA